MLSIGTLRAGNERRVVGAARVPELAVDEDEVRVPHRSRFTDEPV